LECRYEQLKMDTRIRSTAILVLAALISTIVPWHGQASGEDYLDYYEQGEFALRVRKWERAVEHFTKSIDDNPNFFVAYHNRAIAYSKMGEYDKSIQDLKKAVELNPHYPDAFRLMGLVHEIRKDYPAALHAYQEALAREKSPPLQKAIEKDIQDVETKIKKK
jgi:tetratricopeptide (TPR) repeat protein